MVCDLLLHEPDQMQEADETCVSTQAIVEGVSIQFQGYSCIVVSSGYISSDSKYCRIAPS